MHAFQKLAPPTLRASYGSSFPDPLHKLLPFSQSTVLQDVQFVALKEKHCFMAFLDFEASKIKNLAKLLILTKFKLHNPPKKRFFKNNFNS